MAWPSGSRPPRRGGRAGLVLAIVLAVAAGVLAGSLWLRGSSSSPVPSGSAVRSASPPPDASPVASAHPAATPEPSAAHIPLVVVGGFNDYKVTAITSATLKTRLAAGTLVVPCGAEAAVALALGATGTGAAPCVAADRITAFLDPGSTDLALIPPALVTPRVKVIPLESADLFGQVSARQKAYPLTIALPAIWPPAWSAWDGGDVRVVVTTGVTCPDRGVSLQTIVKGRGWGWLAEAGTARVTGTHIDRRFGQRVVDLVRTGNLGAVRDLVGGADVAVSDFECAMTRNFKQHNSGTVFTIDPRVATLMADIGFDVATVAADHTTNAGIGAVGETVDFFRSAGVQPTGAGRTLDEALAPAIVDANGVKFGFVGFDAIGGATSATLSSPGVANLTTKNVKAAVARARAAGAQVVIALVQWSSVEYQAKFTDFQLGVRKQLFAAGVDHIVGGDFHWAGALAISLEGSTYHYAGASQGNFWFDQDWSRQTQEAVITSLTFVGPRLVQVRLQPTVVVDNAQLNLTDPATDGQVVLKQVLSVSTLPPQ
jgi:poly-gamma-glutamate synthesis protein (capsule biosynthesis protein)